MNRQESDDLDYWKRNIQQFIDEDEIEDEFTMEEE